MCGIIGYVGAKQSPPILLDSLKKLEYRGYDSSGIGVIDVKTNKVVLRKTNGKIQNLQSLIKAQPFPSSHIGISHTRWATHGAPNKKNAHPHANQSGDILVVHNGIIENYQSLKKKLMKDGVKFSSDTDTEVIVHLISHYYKDSLEKAVREAIGDLEGAFALGVISSRDPETLLAARVGSPLIIGLGKGENFIASDVPAILEHTRSIIYLKDYEMAEIKKDSVKVSTFSGKAVKTKIDKVNFKIDAVAKQGFDHFMMKEIHEQPNVLKQMLGMRLKSSDIIFDGNGLQKQQLNKINHIIIVACGTAFHAGLVGKYIIEQITSIPVTVDVSSEFRYRNPIVGKQTAIIAISQSGETADTLAAVREAKSKGAKIISICNVIGSSLSRESDGVLYTHAGPEIGVASTKAYTAQLCMLYILAIKLGKSRGSLKAVEANQLIKSLKMIPAQIEKILAHKNEIARIARANSHFGCFLFLGRNVNFPTALEGALKLKEISYIPAEGYAAGEMKHGPIALIDEYRAVICVAPEADTYDKMISNIQEIRSRKGKVIAIATEGNTDIKNHAQSAVFIPKTNQLLSPLLAVIPLQLIAYYISVKRGCDVDQPRNLAKSVTVE